MFFPPAMPFVNHLHPMVVKSCKKKKPKQSSNHRTMTSHDPMGRRRTWPHEESCSGEDGPTKENFRNYPKPWTTSLCLYSAGAPLCHPFASKRKLPLKGCGYFGLIPNGHAGCRGHHCPCCHPSILSSSLHMTLVTSSLCSPLTTLGR